MPRPLSYSVTTSRFLSALRWCVVHRTCILGCSYSEPQCRQKVDDFALLPGPRTVQHNARYAGVRWYRDTGPSGSPWTACGSRGWTGRRWSGWGSCWRSRATAESCWDCAGCTSPDLRTTAWRGPARRTEASRPWRRPLWRQASWLLCDRDFATE